MPFNGRNVGVIFIVHAFAAFRCILSFNVQGYYFVISITSSSTFSLKGLAAIHRNVKPACKVKRDSTAIPKHCTGVAQVMDSNPVKN